MKVLLATYWLIPHIGGVWTFMNQIRNRLERMGHEVDLLGNSPDYKYFHIYNKGLSLDKEHLLPMLGTKLGQSLAPHLFEQPVIWQNEFDRYCLELSAAYFGLEKYDVIHTQDVISARALARVKPKRTPLVSHIHGSVATEMFSHFKMHPELGIHENSPAYNYFKAMEYYGASGTDLSITANHWQRNMLISQFGVSPEKVAVFQYGLDAEPFWANFAAGTNIRRPPGKKVIIFPARLVFIKGVHVLIEALATLKQARSDWVCWIAGDGDQRAALEEQARRLGLQQEVAFLGNRLDVPGLLGQSDIFVHCCLQDNQPFSVMEAQMAGLPVLVSSAAGLPEMVEHGVTGLISPVGDSVTLFQQLNALLENDAYRIRLGKQAQSWAQSHWSLDLMISRLLEVYGKVIEASGRA
ncbi:glycosyltransferase family 4 protein [Paenibacillus sp. YN15]|uniref:glycosyltransferase family 4 protein n=1 Tax=Paenibacillus sp. YN15 TaxID=1742774 RepID=UPI000DCC8BC9|nr:glycosyltransferase family 4 protein [Paenibacillus sp. YN15]RAV01251.1 glycosyltransferase family 1 protein [Paenibacillus sp. YN15]